jgi:uncharacterized membrane protein YtjA (UPF0391 family)
MSVETNKSISKEKLIMLRWALIFFVIALIAALFGFGGVAGAAAGIGKFVFFAALVLFVVGLIASAAKGGV